MERFKVCFLQYKKVIAYSNLVEVIMEMNIQSPKANIEKFQYNNKEVYLVNGQNFPNGQSHVISLNCE